jgi:hypothetical protein
VLGVTRVVGAEPRYACRACENWTLSEETPGSYAWCPVCDWTDRSLDTVDDQAALLRARISVAENGCADASSPGMLRAPTSEELNPVGRVALERDVAVRDAERIRITAQIHDAFANVSGGSRISLHDALRADIGDVEGFVAWDGHDVKWSDIPTDVLDQYASRGSQMFAYWDDSSLVYYLPPYMIRGLHGFTSVALFALGTVTTSGTAAGMKTRPATLFTDAQQRTIRAFLRFVTVYGPDHEDAASLTARWNCDNDARSDTAAN